MVHFRHIFLCTFSKVPWRYMEKQEMEMKWKLETETGNRNWKLETENKWKRNLLAVVVLARFNCCCF